MVNISAVVVTYNRKELLKENLQSLLNQTHKLDKIYIVDNASTDGTFEYIKEITEYENVEYIKLPDNVGGSGGFYAGIKKAYDDGMDYIWGMDDDAIPKLDALENLVKYESKCKEACLWSNCNRDDFNGDIKEVSNWMFVGFFLPRDIISKVGMPRGDFFIYHDDSEYAYRIVKSGYKIFKVKNSVINHGDFADRPKFERKFLGKNLEFSEMPDWKLYYYVRNDILMYGGADINKYKELLYRLPKQLMVLFLLNKKQCKVFLRGYFNGIFGVTGKKH